MAFTSYHKNIIKNTTQIIKNTKPLFKKPDLYRYIIPYVYIKKYLGNILQQKSSSFYIFTFLPDELLYDIPESKKYLYSLFQGFLVTFNEENNPEGYKISNCKNKTTTKNNTLKNPSNQDTNNTSLEYLKKEKDQILYNINIINIQKSLMSSEIREINEKINVLGKIKSGLFDKLQKLRHQETEIINTLWSTEAKIIDGIELEQPIVTEDTINKQLSETDVFRDPEFMSKSIYDKLNSLKIDSCGIQKNSMCILHEQFKPGSNIKSWKSHTETITAIDFDMPFGTMVTASLDDQVKVWNLLSGECQASVKCLQLENNIVATGSMDASIKLWNLQHTESYKTSEPCYSSNYINRKIKPNDVIFSFTNNSQNIDISSFNTEKNTNDFCITTLQSHMDEITALHFIGNILISGSSDKTLKQWDLGTGKCVQTLDVLWATAQCNNLLPFIDNFKSKTFLKEKEYDFVGAIQYFDTALASGTSDGVVRLWDLRSGLIIKTLFGHTAPITCLQFDKHHLITGSIDRSIRVQNFLKILYLTIIRYGI
ncbi:hypothetical protein PCANB_002659 [Pneumocystis canis]|nr:hypothetical protein PCANB_002659 [Pneumocystis canis]